MIMKHTHIETRIGKRQQRSHRQDVGSIAVTLCSDHVSASEEAKKTFLHLLRHLDLGLRPVGVEEHHSHQSTSSDNKGEADGGFGRSNAFISTGVTLKAAGRKTEILRSQPMVESAYYIPSAIPAHAPATSTETTGLVEGRMASDIGLSACRSLRGGDGVGVRIADCEYGWLHSSDQYPGLSPVLGTEEASEAVKYHGSAVLALLLGLRPLQHGGICEASDVLRVSLRSDSASMIRQASKRLRKGDILLIESQRPGPLFQYQGDELQRGYIPIEWWPLDFAAIRDATEEGIIVVAAAGNGCQNLDDILYDHGSDFGRDWSNSFRRGERDSGAILVGAGGAPGSVHGHRVHIPYSNYGSSCDVQGWGDCLFIRQADQDANPQDIGFYNYLTRTFGGTSSAAAMVAGAIACLQGVCLQLFRESLSPLQLRTALRKTGKCQRYLRSYNGPRNIGSLIDLEQLTEDLGIQDN